MRWGTRGSSLYLSAHRCCHRTANNRKDSVLLVKYPSLASQTVACRSRQIFQKYCLEMVCYLPEPSEWSAGFVHRNVCVPMSKGEGYNDGMLQTVKSSWGGQVVRNPCDSVALSVSPRSEWGSVEGSATACPWSAAPAVDQTLGHLPPTICI